MCPRPWAASDALLMSFDRRATSGCKPSAVINASAMRLCNGAPGAGISKDRIPSSVNSCNASISPVCSRGTTAPDMPVVIKRSQDSACATCLAASATASTSFSRTRRMRPRACSAESGSFSSSMYSSGTGSADSVSSVGPMGSVGSVSSAGSRRCSKAATGALRRRRPRPACLARGKRKANKWFPIASPSSVRAEDCFGPAGNIASARSICSMFSGRGE
mmetsp:Transcript_70648/g.155849  ORF Transcript_70648/g.155849 Transcript_70648/m.155849 type:complete len:219 (+) Transcript_70648:244-900(+)